jgi:hypothetical protein
VLHVFGFDQLLNWMLLGSGISFKRNTKYQNVIAIFLRDSILPLLMDQQFQTHRHIIYVYENDLRNDYGEGCWRIKGLAKMDQETILGFPSSNVSSTC